MNLAEIQAIDRPDRQQVTLIIAGAVLTSVMSCGFLFPFVLLGLIPVFIRYATTRYRFDEEGVSVSWGFLFKQESQLTFDKIQDIHLRRGFLERWLGLGTVDVQTASGSAGAEVSLYGLKKHYEVRDFLYGKMRSARGLDRKKKKRAPEGKLLADADAGGEDALALLRSIRDEVQRLQREAAARPQGEAEGSA